MTPEQAYDHCKKHGRNSELEKIVLTNPYCAYNYARDVIKDRWIEAEKIIINDPYYAYFYARDVIKNRWIEAENIIATNSECAFCYALNIIKDKLPEHMHNMMLLHADGWAKRYLNLLNRQPYKP